MEEVKEIVIELENGKKKTTYLGPDNRIGDAYWVFITHDKKIPVFCLVEKDGTPLTPLLKKELISFFTTKDKQNICIEIKDYDDTISYFYHFQKRDNHYKCVFSTDDNNKTQFKITKTPNDDYWFLYSPNTKIALYSPKETKQLTPFFDELELIDKEHHHFAYFSKNIIIKNNDSEEKVATKLVGFIGYDGEFSSRIYDTEDAIYQNEEDKYHIISRSGVEGMKEFSFLCDNITHAYQNFYNEKQDYINEVIGDLFLEKIEFMDIPSYKNPAKILEFRRNSSNDKK